MTIDVKKAKLAELQEKLDIMRSKIRRGRTVPYELQKDLFEEHKRLRAEIAIEEGLIKAIDEYDDFEKHRRETFNDFVIYGMIPKRIDECLKKEKDE